MAKQQYKGLVVWRDKQYDTPDVYAYVGDTYDEVYDQVMSYTKKEGSILIHLDIKLIGQGL